MDRLATKLADVFGEERVLNWLERTVKWFEKDDREEQVALIVAALAGQWGSRRQVRRALIALGHPEERAKKLSAGAIGITYLVSISHFQAKRIIEQSSRIADRRAEQRRKEKAIRRRDPRSNGA